MKLGTILVPLDGSALAEAALPKALELAEVSGARMLLLRAAQAQTLPGVDPTEAQVRVVSEAETYLAEIRKRLTQQSGVKVETSVWYGPAAHAIVEAARVRRVDAIVMTTHGRSGLGRLLLGSVAESVLRGTHPATPGGGRSRSSPERQRQRLGGAMRVFHRILHATDFSSASRPALIQAISLNRAALRVVCALPPLVPADGGGFAFVPPGFT